MITLSSAETGLPAATMSPDVRKRDLSVRPHLEIDLVEIAAVQKENVERVPVPDHVLRRIRPHRDGIKNELAALHLPAPVRDEAVPSPAPHEDENKETGSGQNYVRPDYPSSAFAHSENPPLLLQLHAIE